jgi:hypothetical protein
MVQHIVLPVDSDAFFMDQQIDLLDIHMLRIEIRMMVFNA